MKIHPKELFYAKNILFNILISSLIVGSIITLNSIAEIMVGNSKEDFNNPFFLISLRLDIIIFSGIIFIILFTKRISIPKYRLSIIVLSCFLSLYTWHLFMNTSYGLNGPHGDAWFHLSSITRFKYNNGFVDYTFKDLPSHYPPLYFYILGKIAWLFNKDPYEMMKIGNILTALCLPHVSFSIWRKTTPERTSMLITFFCFLLMPFFFFLYNPYTYIALSLIVPWYLYLMKFSDKSDHDNSYNFYTIVIGSVIFLFYYYWFFIIGIALVIHLTSIFIKENLRRTTMELARLMKIFIGIALVTSYFWIRYLFEIFTNDTDFMQNRYLVSHMLEFPLPFLELSIMGIMLLIGLFYLIIVRNNLNTHLLTLLVSQYLWVFAGYFLTLNGTATLGFRAIPLITIVLLASFAFFINSFYKSFKELWNTGKGYKLIKWMRNLSSEIILPSAFPKEAFLVGFIMIILFFGQTNLIAITTNRTYKQSFEEIKPEELITMVEELDYKDKVFLTSEFAISVYLPVFLFIPPNSYFAHPSALVSDRIDFLDDISKLNNATEFADEIKNNKFDRIDFILFREYNGMYSFSVLVDAFPKGSEKHYITFNVTIFSEDYFDIRVQNGYTIIEPINK